MSEVEKGYGSKVKSFKKDKQVASSLAHLHEYV